MTSTPPRAPRDTEPPTTPTPGRAATASMVDQTRVPESLRSLVHPELAPSNQQQPEQQHRRQPSDPLQLSASLQSLHLSGALQFEPLDPDNEHSEATFPSSTSDLPSSSASRSHPRAPHGADSPSSPEAFASSPRRHYYTNSVASPPNTAGGLSDSQNSPPSIPQSAYTREPRDLREAREYGGSRGDREGGYPSNGDRPASSSRHSHSNSDAQSQAARNSVVIKVGMVGDAQIGKTSLMVKYVEGSFDEDYIQTLGVNFMEKTISIRNTEITFSIWDLGGQREFVNMLPLVCNDAVAILFMFDLTRKSTLNSIKEWYRQARGFNKTAIPFLVGTKYDHFINFQKEEQEEISRQAKKFAKAMKASLIFSSTSHSINVQKIFKIVLSKAFDLKCTIPEIENVGEPLLLYQDV